MRISEVSERGSKPGASGLARSRSDGRRVRTRVSVLNKTGCWPCFIAGDDPGRHQRDGQPGPDEARIECRRVPDPSKTNTPRRPRSAFTR